MDKAKIDAIYSTHIKKMNSLKDTFRRDNIDDIDWDGRLTAIKGARGVGKTTLMLQYIKETYKTNTTALYISMDDLQLAGLTIFDIATHHDQQGGTHLFIDEIHKYQNWSIELKNIYDTITNLKVVFLSSSILQVYKGYADLSRRAVTYQLHGLSFRAYLQVETKMPFKKYSLEQILNNHVAIATEILQRIKPFMYFKNYLQYGYFPFYLEGKKTYDQKLNNILNVTLEVDLPYILDVNIHSVQKLKRLIKIIANAVPFTPNITKLAEAIEVTRNTVLQYLLYLEQAEIFNLLHTVEKSYTHLIKPEKIFLQNTNVCYAFNNNNPNIGTVRELFFLNQLKTVAQVNYTKQGDFLVNEKYIFEIGGAKKTFAQIADILNSFLAADDIEYGVGNKIPIWLFGFLS